jgi:pimeloyl-ACP methyl ester carboxylesterase
MEDRSITLSTKPGASLHVSIFRPQAPEQNPLSDTLVVFLNGLMLPSASWSGAVSRLIDCRRESKQPVPALLCYDRYGQGKSEPDPTDAPDSPYGHDARAVVADLHQLLVQVSQDALRRRLEDLRLVLVCNSIGCALARLFAAEHPGRVEAFLFLDSMMANSDFVSVFPDPDDPAFDGGRSSQLPEGVTAEDLRHARAQARKLFHPDVPNAERLDRRQLRELLPRADGPALPDGPGGRSPLLTVVGHDWDVFAEQAEKVRSELGKPPNVIMGRHTDRGLFPGLHVCAEGCH